jgi:hypothetical protein
MEVLRARLIKTNRLSFTPSDRLPFFIIDWITQDPVPI